MPLSEFAELHPFSLLTSDALELLFAAFEECSFPAGADLMLQGDEGDCLFVLLDGKAEVWSHGQDGQRHQIIVLERGEVVGEMALLTNQPRTATVTAQTDLNALRLSALAFHDLADRHPEVSTLLTEVVAARLGERARDGLQGKRVDRYRILATIARGAMGVVYEAADEEDEGRPVALKMMSHRLLYHPGAAQRFQREAQVLMDLDHRNVARVLSEFRAYRTGFIAMELCRGIDLQTWIRREAPFAEADVRRIVGQLADALLYLEERRVVHRDLKPDNILVTTDGIVKLIDFGLAKPIGWATDLSSATGPALFGTPLYMAPEQFAGEALGPPADWYALGCITYELLTGRRLFQCPTVSELLLAKVSARPPSKEELGPDLGEGLHTFLQECLEANPARRRPDLRMAAAWAEPVPPPAVPLRGV